jgi:AraC-like DNA-binding protein
MPDIGSNSRFRDGARQRDGAPPGEEPPLRINRQRDPVLDGPGHVHPHLEVNAVFQGAMHYRHDGRPFVVPAGRLGLLWAGLPHALAQVEPGTDVLALAVPIATALRWPGCDGLIRVLMGGEVLLAPDSALDLKLAARWSLEGTQPARSPLVLLEVEAFVRRTALALAGAGGGAVGAGAAVGGFGDRALSGAFGRMVAHLHVHHGDADALLAAARESGLKRDTATRLFRRCTGVSPRAYLMRVRLAHAHRRLLASDEPVTDIALAAGFGSLGRFYAAFAKLYGRTPTAVRQSS